jgi:U2 small nuclear ribonucleoprotein B''
MIANGEKKQWATTDDRPTTPRANFHWRLMLAIGARDYVDIAGRLDWVSQNNSHNTTCHMRVCHSHIGHTGRTRYRYWCWHWHDRYRYEYQYRYDMGSLARSCVPRSNVASLHDSTRDHGMFPQGPPVETHPTVSSESFSTGTMLQPNATLYIKNIDWKIKKGLLRRALYSLFSRHGKVLEIITLRKDGLRGQAFVIMNDVQAATAALQAEQGFTFFGKDMVIEYARVKSDRIAKRDGDYVPKAKRHKVAKEPASSDNDDDEPQGEMEPEMEHEAVAQPEQLGTSEVDTSSSPPSKMLLAQDLPPECNEMMLGMLFRQYAGYKEVRMPRPGLAFIEFEDDSLATVALKALNGFKLTPHEALKLSYGKA